MWRAGENKTTRCEVVVRDSPASLNVSSSAYRRVCVLSVKAVEMPDRDRCEQG